MKTWTLLLVLALFLLPACAGEEKAVREQAMTSFCGRFPAPMEPVRAGFDGDAALFERAGDPDTASRIRDALDTDPDPSYGETAVFLRTDVTPEEQAVIQQALVELVGSENIHYESQHEAYLRASEMFADEPDLLAKLDESALPSSFRVRSSGDTDPQAIEDAVGSLPGIDRVRLPEALLVTATGWPKAVREVQKDLCPPSDLTTTVFP